MKNAIAVLSDVNFQAHLLSLGLSFRYLLSCMLLCAPPVENICVPVRSLAQVISEENHSVAGSAGSPMVYLT